MDKVDGIVQNKSHLNDFYTISNIDVYIDSLDECGFEKLTSETNSEFYGHDIKSTTDIYSYGIDDKNREYVVVKTALPHGDDYFFGFKSGLKYHFIQLVNFTIYNAVNSLLSDAE